MWNGHILRILHHFIQGWTSSVQKIDVNKQPILISQCLFASLRGRYWYFEFQNIFWLKSFQNINFMRKVRLNNTALPSTLENIYNCAKPIGSNKLNDIVSLLPILLLECHIKLWVTTTQKKMKKTIKAKLLVILNLSLFCWL